MRILNHIPNQMGGKWKPDTCILFSNGLLWSKKERPRKRVYPGQWPWFKVQNRFSVCFLVDGDDVSQFSWMWEPRLRLWNWIAIVIPQQQKVKINVKRWRPPPAKFWNKTRQEKMSRWAPGIMICRQEDSSISSSLFLKSLSTVDLKAGLSLFLKRASGNESTALSLRIWHRSLLIIWYYDMLSKKVDITLNHHWTSPSAAPLVSKVHSFPSSLCGLFRQSCKKRKPSKVHLQTWTVQLEYPKFEFPDGNKSSKKFTSKFGHINIRQEIAYYNKQPDNSNPDINPCRANPGGNGLKQLMTSCQASSWSLIEKCVFPASLGLRCSATFNLSLFSSSIRGCSFSFLQAFVWLMPSGVSSCSLSSASSSSPALQTLSVLSELTTSSPLWLGRRRRPRSRRRSRSCCSFFVGRGCCRGRRRRRRTFPPPAPSYSRLFASSVREQLRAKATSEQA